MAIIDSMNQERLAPWSLKIGSTIYSVEMVTRLLDDNGKEMLGQTDHSKATLRINTEQDAQLLFQTLLHEMLHAIEYELGWRPNGEELKESQIEAIANMLSGILRNNPELLECIPKSV